MGQNCTYCTKDVSTFSGRHDLGINNNNSQEAELLLKASLCKEDCFSEDYATLICFQDGEFVVGCGFIIEIKRHEDGKLSYSGWSAGPNAEQSQQLWTGQYSNISAVLFTVDSTDPRALKKAKNELHKFLKEEHFRAFYLLIFCNLDRDNQALNTTEIEHKLKLKILKNCVDYRVQPVVGKKGCGFQYGAVWLFDVLETQYSILNSVGSGAQNIANTQPK